MSPYRALALVLLAALTAAALFGSIPGIASPDSLATTGATAADTAAAALGPWPRMWRWIQKQVPRDDMRACLLASEEK